jgi:hypothetical protein
MKTRSGLSDTGRFVAAVFHYCELELIRFNVFDLSNILREFPGGELLKPFVQLETDYAIRTGRPEKWYSLELRKAIDELVALDVVKRVDNNWLFVQRDMLRAIVRELDYAVPELMDHTLMIVKTADAIKAAAAKKA